MMKLDLIPKSSLYYTPGDLAELDEMIRRLSNDSERSVAYQYTMYAFNLANKLLADRGIEIKE